MIRLPIPDDCCGKARELIAGGLDPDTVLEFMRGDVVCLRGTVRAFASRMLSDKSHGGTRHVRYDPVEAQRLATLRHRATCVVR